MRVETAPNASAVTTIGFDSAKSPIPKKSASVQNTSTATTTHDTGWLATWSDISSRDWSMWPA